MATCKFFNKTHNAPCTHKAVAMTLQPFGKAKKACNGHASTFALNAMRHGIKHFGGGTGYGIMKLGDWSITACVCGFMTTDNEYWHHHIVGANHEHHYRVM